MRELDDFLELEMSKGVLDSTGGFSLSRAEALKKLAAFQLLGEMDWVLKVVQAAVRAGFLEIDLRLSKSHAEFRLLGPCRWRLEDFEASFYEPESRSDRSLQALKEALWSVSVHDPRPFCLVGQSWPEALFWNGEHLSRQAGDPPQVTRLTISHRLREDRGFPVLREIEAARRNASILQQLRDKAFACPIPLRVDARRVDGLLLCPGHGLSSKSYPFALGLLPGELPPLACPQTKAADEPSYVDSKLHSGLEKLVPVDSLPPQSVAAAALLTGHVAKVGSGKSSEWAAIPRPCRVYWVVDGVVVDCRALPLSERSCSIGLIASAEGLVTDVSGLCLQVNQDYQVRLNRLCRLADDFVAQADLHFEAMIARARANGKWAGALVFFAAAGVSIFYSPFAIPLTLWGFLKMFVGPQEETAISKKLTKDLQVLQEEWPRLAGSTEGVPGS